MPSFALQRNLFSQEGMRDAGSGIRGWVKGKGGRGQHTIYGQHRGGMSLRSYARSCLSKGVRFRRFVEDRSDGQNATHLQLLLTLPNSEPVFFCKTRTKTVFPECSAAFRTKRVFPECSAVFYIVAAPPPRLSLLLPENKMTCPCRRAFAIVVCCTWYWFSPPP